MILTILSVSNRAYMHASLLLTLQLKPDLVKLIHMHIYTCIRSHAYTYYSYTIINFYIVREGDAYVWSWSCSFLSISVHFRFSVWNVVWIRILITYILVYIYMYVHNYNIHYTHTYNYLQMHVHTHTHIHIFILKHKNIYVPKSTSICTLKYT